MKRSISQALAWAAPQRWRTGPPAAASIHGRGLLGRALLVALALTLALAAEASAQCPRALGDDVILARVAWSEAGIDADPREVAALAAVLRSRAEVIGTDFAGAACAYSSRNFRPTRTDRRRWLAHLDRRGREPEGWADSYTVCRREVCEVRDRPPWHAFEARWRALISLAARVLAGEVAHGCSEAPGWWGGEMDAHRARAMGLRELRCEGVRNLYYAPLPRGER